MSDIRTRDDHIKEVAYNRGFSDGADRSVALATAKAMQAYYTGLAMGVAGTTVSVLGILWWTGHLV